MIVMFYTHRWIGICISNWKDNEFHLNVFKGQIYSVQDIEVPHPRTNNVLWTCMVKRLITMRDDVVYNKWDNHVMVKTQGDLIFVICHSEEQQETVVKKMTTDNCLLEEYEVWEDEKIILTFRVLDNYEIKPELN